MARLVRAVSRQVLAGVARTSRAMTSMATLPMGQTQRERVLQRYSTAGTRPAYFGQWSTISFTTELPVR